VTYNSDCCGFSMQYRRFEIEPRRQEYRFALAISNIGTFGSLKRQERIFLESRIVPSALRSINRP